MTSENTTTQNIDAIRDDLWSRQRGLWAERRELEARLHDVQEQIDRLAGDPLSAEYHRLAAESERNPSPEATQIAHRAWVVAMAAAHVRNGTSPDDYCADEIQQEMERA